MARRFIVVASGLSVCPGDRLEIDRPDATRPTGVGSHSSRGNDAHDETLDRRFLTGIQACSGDPDTPAYQEASGFTPDAVRVLTVTVLQLSLERYHDDVGAYPTTLDALFPGYAPPGPDSRPMTAPPAVADGYTYTGSGDTYTLSVVLAGGAPYVMTAPVAP